MRIKESARRICIIAALALPIGQAYAFRTDTTTIDSPIERLDYHIRVVAPGKASTLTLYWNNPSDCTSTRAEVRLPEKYHDDSQLLPEGDYSVIASTDRGDSLVAKGKMKIDYGTGKNAGFSIILRNRESGSVIEMGGAGEACSVPVPFHSDSALKIYCDIPDGLSILRSTAMYMRLDKPEYSRFGTVDSLLGYLAESKDPREGIWEYLDRKIDPSKATQGGKYTLACVREGKGYILIFLDGSSSPAWRPLRIKARLEPSGFIDNYDMIWYIDNGNRYSEDTNASFINAGSILECRFPEVESVMRFRRRDAFPRSPR